VLQTQTDPLTCKKLYTVVDSLTIKSLAALVPKLELGNEGKLELGNQRNGGNRGVEGITVRQCWQDFSLRKARRGGRS
jgi:hypothetical protein